MGWDEVLVFATPVIVLVALQIAGRRKRAGGDPDQDVLDDGDDDEETP
jgi:hypothetical protein